MAFAKRNHNTEGMEVLLSFNFYSHLAALNQGKKKAPSTYKLNP